MSQLIQSPTLATPGSASAQTIGEVNNEFVQKLMDLLANTHDGCYSCGETYALLDEYAEKVMLNAEETAVLMPLVQQHLDRCPDCRTEFEVLLRILQSE